MELTKTMMPFIEEYNEYFCIRRINDNKVAMDNTNSPKSKTLAFINFPILFKARPHAIHYLVHKVGARNLPLYKVETFGSTGQTEKGVIIGEYILDE